MKNKKLLNFFNEDGFSTSFALILIFSISICLVPITFMVISQSKNVEKYSSFYEERNKVQKILMDFEKDLQTLCLCESDFENSTEIDSLLSKYCEYKLSMKDVSTGINRRFLSEKFFEKGAIKEFFEANENSISTEYGWINKNLSDEKVFESVLEDFDEENIEEVFPLINELPLFNKNFMEKDFIEAVTKECKRGKSKEKEQKLLMNFLGTKTTFWKIRFETVDWICEAIFAAIPERKTEEKNSVQIEKYELVEKKIERKKANI